MRATGIVRRIDDLGRIVVPKEIRRVLRIREGDSMELFTDTDGAIVVKKYSPFGELGNVARQCAESIAQVSGQMTIITDRDSVIAAAGTPKHDVIGKRISKKLESILAERDLFHNNNKKSAVNITESENLEQSEQIICPIICDGEVIGSVIIATAGDSKEMSGIEEKLAIMASKFLGRRMEV